jgi:integrase
MRMGYIKTNKIVSPKQITKSGDIIDPVVNDYCSSLILRYTDIINRHDITNMSVPEVIELLTDAQAEASYSDYARQHIRNMINTGHERNAKTYKLALENLERYLGTNKIVFSQLTSAALNGWIKSLSYTRRAKEQYSICVRQMFKKAMIDLNDEERDIMRIKFNPWSKVQIPKCDTSEKKAISAEECRLFFNRPLPQTKMISSLPELGRDVAMLILCLGGMNTVDLYNLKKENYRNGIICYKRSKTRHSRSDEAYFEIRVEPFIKPIFEKYLDKTDSEYLLTFYQRYCDHDSLCSNANSGIKKICTDMGIPKKEQYSCYSFRHTWATIAQNDCDANLYEVAFGLNHSHGMKVTRGYVKIDFTPAWKLNAKVIDFIFFSDKRSKQGLAQDTELSNDKIFRFSAKTLINAKAYYMGQTLAEIEDIGYNNIEEVIRILSHDLPGTIPDRAAVQFRIINKDSQREAVYERTKGKGF